MNETPTLPWPERINMLAVHPEAAQIEDIQRMASELGEFLQNKEQLRELRQIREKYERAKRRLRNAGYGEKVIEGAFK